MSNKTSIKLVAFSTNTDQYSPIIQITKHVNQTKLKNFKQLKQYQADFNYQPKDCPYMNISLIEVKKTDTAYSMCSNSDSYILLIDLEAKGAFRKIEDIIDYMIEYCNLERKLFVIGLYKDIANVPEELKEESMTSYLDLKQLNYDYVDIGIDALNEVTQVLEYIMQETLENKSSRGNKNIEVKHSTIEINIDKSKSTCIIF